LNEQPGGMDAQLAGQEPHQPASRQQGKHLSPAAFLSRLGKVCTQLQCVMVHLCKSNLPAIASLTCSP
jgi:hypothetical protein